MTVEYISWTDIISKYGKSIVNSMDKQVDFLVGKDGESDFDDDLAPIVKGWADNGLVYEKEQLSLIKGSVAKLNLPNEHAIGIVGQPGVGKTLISAGIAQAYSVITLKRAARISVITPAGVIYDFKKDWMKTLGSNAEFIIIDDEGYDALDALEIIVSGRGTAARFHSPKELKDMLNAIGVSKLKTSFGESIKAKAKTVFKHSINGSTYEISISKATLIFRGEGQTDFINNTLTMVDGAHIMKKKPTRMELFIFGRDRSKMSFTTRPAFNERKYKDGKILAKPIYECPKCSNTLTKRVKVKQGNTFVTERVNLTLPEVISNSSRCNSCGEILKQAMGGGQTKEFSHLNKKWKFSGYNRIDAGSRIRRLSRYGNVFDIAVIDEIHEFRTEDSLQGKMMADICYCADKRIGMSGTWTGGYADDIYYIFWRLMPNKMIAKGYDYRSTLGWIEEFATKQISTRYLKGGRVNSKMTRTPGINPTMFGKFFLENFVFLKLTDMKRGKDLKYVEEPKVIDPKEALLDAYNELSNGLKANTKAIFDKILIAEKNFFQTGFGETMSAKEIQSRVRQLRMSMYSKLVRVRMNWLDVPHTEGSISFTDVAGNEYKLGSAIQLDEGTTTPKEEEMLKIVDNSDQGVLIFIESSGTDVLPNRIISKLEAVGVKAKYMSREIPVKKRQEWLEKAYKNGNKVVICNPRTVSTGLNLYDYTDIIFYQPVLNTFTVRQASRRSLRLMQTKPVQVYFMAHAETSQEDALNMIATAIDSARQAEGDMTRYGIEKISASDNNVLRELTKQFMEECGDDE